MPERIALRSALPAAQEASQSSRRAFTMKGLLLLALFATGCAVAARRRPGDPEDSDPADPLPEPNPADPLPEPANSEGKVTSFRFQVDADSELAEDARIAARSWSEATGRTITATPDGTIPILLVQQLDPGCDATPNARGCSYMDGKAGGWIEIMSDIHPNYRYGTVLHEMGHHLQGSGGHVLNNPDAVMAPIRKLNVYLLTPDDVAFVCTGPRFSCAA